MTRMTTQVQSKGLHLNPFDFVDSLCLVLFNFFDFLSVTWMIRFVEVVLKESILLRVVLVPSA